MSKANQVHIGGEVFCLKCCQEIVKRWKDGKCKKHGCKLHQEPDPNEPLPYYTFTATANRAKIVMKRPKQKE
jgi:hypothetical protein